MRAAKDIRTQNERVLVGFRSAYVFDVSQTEGAELPELSGKVTGNVGECRERLVDFILGQNIKLEFNDRTAPALGISNGGKIVLFPGRSAREEFSTLVHELAHEMLPKRSGGSPPRRQYGRLKPKRLPLWSRRPSDYPRAALPPITSTFITATQPF